MPKILKHLRDTGKGGVRKIYKWNPELQKVVEVDRPEPKPTVGIKMGQHPWGPEWKK